MKKGISITVDKGGNFRVERDCSIEKHEFIVASMGATYFSSCFAEECPRCASLDQRINEAWPVK